MSYRRYSVPSSFSCPNLLPPGPLGWTPWDALGSITSSRHSTHYHLLFPESLKGFLKASSYLSPSCFTSISNSVTRRSKAESHFHICSYKHGEIRVSDKVCAGMRKCGFSLWTVRAPFPNVYLSHTCTHTPSSAHSSSLVQVQVWWGWPKRRGLWGLLRHFPFLIFFYRLVLASPKKLFKETPLWQFWIGQHSESYDCHLLRTQSLRHTSQSAGFPI